MCVAPSCAAARSSVLERRVERNGVEPVRLLELELEPLLLRDARQRVAYEAIDPRKPIGVGERTSTEKSATSGMTLKPPGETVHMPTLAVMSSRSSFVAKGEHGSRSPARASRRSPIGVVPA